MKIIFDDDSGTVSEVTASGEVSHALDTPEAFEAINKAWLRVSWDVKYIYAFAWLGRPIIQLPEDMLRIQEVIFEHQPDVLIETAWPMAAPWFSTHRCSKPWARAA